MSGGGSLSVGARRKRRVAEVGPVQVIDGYEKVMLEDGGFKKRRVGEKHWQRRCNHGRQPSRCKECGEASIKECRGASISRPRSGAVDVGVVQVVDRRDQNSIC